MLNLIEGDPYDPLGYFKGEVDALVPLFEFRGEDLLSSLAVAISTFNLVGVFFASSLGPILYFCK